MSTDVISAGLPRSGERGGGLVTPQRVFLLGLSALMFLLIVLPIGILALGSFLTDPPRALRLNLSGLTLQNYAELFRSGNLLGLMGNTLMAASAGTAGAVLIGVSLAWLAIRTDVPGRQVIDAVSVMPMFIPPLIGGFAWQILGSPQSGILNVIARSIGIDNFVNMYSLAGIAFVFAIYYAPYVYLFVAASLRNMDASLEEAAAMAGAGRVRTLRQITLPLIAPALLSSALLVFVLLVQLFAIPAVLGQPAGIQFMSVRIWELIGFAPPKVNQASALGVLLICMTIALVLFQHHVLRRRQFVTVAGKGMRPERVSLGVLRWPVAGLSFAYLLCVVILPYAALLFVALRNNLFFFDLAGMINLSQFSLRHFETAFNDNVVLMSLQNSFLATGGTVLLGCILYFVVSYTVNRTTIPGRHVLDAIAVMPIGIPGLMIGIGFLWSWITLPIGIYGTMWIIIFAFIAQFSPQGVRIISSSLVQIHPELEESSRLSGAGFLYTIRRVVVPLVSPGIMSAVTLLAVFSLRELSTVLFLYAPDTRLFSVAMFDFWIRADVHVVSVMALIQTSILLVIVVLGRSALRN